MALTTDTLARYALKKLFGLAHTGAAKDPSNEAEAVRQFLTSAEITTYPISTTAGAVASTILNCTNATDGTATSRLQMVVDPSSSKAYFATVPASHDLLNYTNPLTGAAYQVGDRVSFIIPKKFGSSWRPILYSSGVEVPPSASQDWLLDDFGVVVSEDDLSLSTGRLACYVYVGRTVSSGAPVRVAKAGTLVGTRGRINFIEGSNVTITATDDSGSDEIDVTIASTGGGGAVSSVTAANGSLTISPTTGSVLASINLGHPNVWTTTQDFTLITGDEINLGSFAPSQADNKFASYDQTAATDYQVHFYDFYSCTGNGGDKDGGAFSIETWATAGSRTLSGLTANAIKRGTSNTTETLQALFGYCYSHSAASGNVGTLRALRFLVEMDGAGSVTTGEVAKLEINNVNTGTMTTGKHLYIPAALNSGGGAITTLYGIHLEKQTVGGTNYEMFLDTDGRIYFRETGTSIHSNATGELTLTAATRVNVSNGFKIGTLTGAIEAASGVVSASNRSVLSYLGL